MNKCACGVFCYVEHPPFNGCYVEHPLFARQAGTGLTLLRVAIVKSHVERLLNYFLFAVIFNYNYSYIIQYCYYK